MSKIIILNCDENSTSLVKKSFINMKMGRSRVDKNSFNSFTDIKEAFIMMKKVETPFIICNIQNFEKEIYNLLVMLERSTTFLKVKVILLSDNVKNIHEKILKKKNLFFVIDTHFSKEQLFQKINSTIKEKKEKKEREKVVRYRNQNGAKIVLCAVEKYIVKIFKSKANQNILKKSVLTQFTVSAEIAEEDYFDIAYKILSPYIEKKSSKLNNKILHCILKGELDKNKVLFVGHIYDDLTEKFSDEFLLKIEKGMLDRRITENQIALEFLPLDTLVHELQEKNSSASPLSYQNCSQSMKTMYKLLLQIDCDINSEKVQQSLKRLTLLESFYKLYKKEFESGKISYLVKNEKLDFSKKSILITKSNTLLNKVDFILSKYLYHFSNELWRSAKFSDVIVNYFKIRMKKVKMSNYAYARYLTQKLDLTVNAAASFEKSEEYFDKLDREIIVFVGDDADMLHKSKRALEDYLRTVNNQRVSVYGFTKETIFEVWLKSNTPTRIVVTDKFESKLSNSGLDYINYLHKKMKNSMVFQNRAAFLLSDNGNVVKNIEESGNLKALKFPMEEDNLRDFILYN